MTEKPLMEELRDEFEALTIHLRNTRADYLIRKQELRTRQSELMLAKTQFNKAYKEWKRARLEVIRAKRRISSVPYRLRKWLTENFGDAWDRMLKE